MATRALSDFRHFESGKIVRIRGKGHFHRRLCQMGVTVGSVIQSARLDEQTDMVLLKVSRGTLRLHRDEMTGIQVETK